MTAQNPDPRRLFGDRPRSSQDPEDDPAILSRRDLDVGDRPMTIRCRSGDGRLSRFLGSSNTDASPDNAKSRKPAWLAGLRLTERHRSRTCPASGYDALLVLKTSWATGPGRSDRDSADVR